MKPTEPYPAWLAFKTKMLRVVFLGMDLRILDALRQCPVELVGAHLPRAPYALIRTPPASPVKWVLRLVLRKRLKIAGIHAGVAENLFRHRIRPLQADNVNGRRFRRLLVRQNPDVGIVANFGQILGAQVLAVPKHGFVNYHPSLLPKYRGPTPLGHILLNREKVSGVTWHRVSEKLDQGPILAQRAFEVHPDDTLPLLEKKALDNAIALLPQLLDDVAGAKLRPILQNESQASYFPKLSQQEKRRLQQMGKMG